MLRWLDRYPVRVEFKGGSRPLLCKTIWITSNLAPEEWYPELDPETRNAFLRRLTNIVHFEYFFIFLFFKGKQPEETLIDQYQH